jgi:hypothetical protein
VKLIINGGATGYDTLVESYCEANGVPYCVYPALWTVFGKSAGPKRNRYMLDFAQPDLVIAFPGGKGTTDTVTLAKEKGIKVEEY